MINGKRTTRVIWGQDTTPTGVPLALVIYADRSFEYIPHTEFNGR